MAWIPRLSWEPYPRIPNRTHSALDIWGALMDGIPLGETLTNTDCMSSDIMLYPQGFARAQEDQLDVPYGQVVAFCVVHELAHAVAGCAIGHESPIWAKACQDMGIKEIEYSKKPADYLGKYAFLDGKLLQAIRKLSTYPGDTWPNEATV